MRCCKFCKWANIAKQPQTIILAPGVTLLQERGCVICMKPAVGMVQTDGAWSCSDYEPKPKKVRRK